MNTPEQQAREMLERMGIRNAYQRMRAGELVELANTIAERDALKAELAAIKGAGEPSTRPAVPLTDEQVWASEEIMAANAETGLLFSVLRKIVRAVEAAHNIKGTTG